jgi:predicted deacylase
MKLFPFASSVVLATACAVPREHLAPAQREAPPWARIGTSVEDRPIEARTFGDGAYRIYLIGGIHGDEHDGGRWVDELCERLGPDGLSGTTLRVVRDLNPDGTAARSRTNARGVDLNRNWPASNFEPSTSRGLAPLSEPETHTVFDDLRSFEPDLAVVLHSARRGPFVNYDGPAEPLALLFADAARAADARWRPVADMGYATPGSFGSWAGKDGRFPVLTIEFERGGDPERARLALFAGVDSLRDLAAR